jgi:hypothetical protein
VILSIDSITGFYAQLNELSRKLIHLLAETAAVNAPAATSAALQKVRNGDI